MSGSSNKWDVAGVVTHVRDGDTFEIGEHNIRLCGIDAPEKGSAENETSTDFLTKLVKGKHVSCRYVGEGTPCDDLSDLVSHDRKVAQCFLGESEDESKDIARILVDNDMAEDWPKYSGGYYKK